MGWGIGWWGFGAWGPCTPSGPDATAPVVTSQDPAPGAVSVPSNAQIKFRLSDSGAPDALHTGIDLASVRVVVAQGTSSAVAFDAGQFTPAFSGPASFVGANAEGGFDFIFDPSVPWMIGTTVTVSLSCVDGNCNALTSSWAFSVGACLAEPCVPITSLSVPSIGGWGDGPWGTVPWGGSGPAMTLPISGGGIPTISTITPTTGSTIGGENFTITGSNLACFAFDDIFSDAVVDPTLWWVSGAGTVTETPFGLGGTLRCAVPATAWTLAGVLSQALKLKTDFFVDVEYSIQTAYLTTKPSGEVVLAGLRAEYDAGNYIQISHVMKGPTEITGTVRCEVWRMGTLLHSKEVDTTSTVGTLGLMRFHDELFNNERAVFIWNGSVLLDAFDCPACTMQVRCFVTNNSIPYAIETWFDNFRSHSVVVFTGPSGSAAVTNLTEVSEAKLIGKTPPTVGAWAGPVDIRVTNGSGNGCSDLCAGCFSYRFPDGFVVGRSEPYRPTRKELSIVDDSVLRNPNQNIGHGLRRLI